MTWEFVDLKEKLSVDVITFLGDIGAVTWAQVREHTLTIPIYKTSEKRSKIVFSVLPHGRILPRVYRPFPNRAQRMD